MNPSESNASSENKRLTMSDVVPEIFDIGLLRFVVVVSTLASETVKGDSAS